jgi:hypothetical protein
MAGLLNLVPRYLPRYGMAPRWTRAVRPLVLVFTAIAFYVTYYFDADVNAQGGAYATGVLVLMTSASDRRLARRAPPAAAAGDVAVRRGLRRLRLHDGANVVERPDGLRIGGIFILAIVTVSLVSRIGRAFQLRAAASRSTRTRCTTSRARRSAARCGSSRTTRTSATPPSTATRSARCGATTTSPAGRR